MTTGPVTKGLLAMTIPIMIMNVTQLLFSMADMLVLRIFANDGAVGAVGACGMLIALCTSLFIGLSAGANVITAKWVGAGNRRHADKAAGTSLVIALVSGIVLMVVGALFAETFLQMTNCPDSLLADATAYFQIYFYGAPVLLLYNFAASILRAVGDTKRPMYYLILGGVAKVIFNLLFVAVLDWNVEGVAVATVISNALASALALYALVKKQDAVRFRLNKNGVGLRELKEILFIGVPAGLQSALYSLANVVITATVNGFGADATTGVSIANQFDGIMYQISYAPSLAVTPYIAQNIGAKKLDRVKEIFLKATLITVAFGATTGAASAVFSGQLSALMSSSPAVIAYSKQKMIIVSSTYFICGINEVVCGVLKGMGKPLPPTIATFVYMCVLRFVWVYAVFPHFPNLTFLYAVWPIGWVLSILTLFVVYLCAFSKLKRSAPLSYRV